jgi:hypothetical protein
VLIQPDCAKNLLIRAELMQTARELLQEAGQDGLAVEPSAPGAGGTGPTGGSLKWRGGDVEEAILVLAMSVMLAVLVIDRLTR